MPEVQVVPMTREDAKALAELEALCFASPRSRQRLEGELEGERSVMLTAWWEGKIAGYVGMEYVLDEGYINDVAVFPQARRHGVGAALLRSLERKSRELGLAFLTLEVREGNAPARALYTFLGYREEGRRPRFYEKPTEDALIMTLRFGEKPGGNLD